MQAVFIANKIAAKKYQMKIIAINFSLDMEHCRHNEVFRRLYINENNNDKKIKAIPIMVYYKEVKKINLPTYKEGFDFIYTLNFWPNFENAKARKVYEMY